MIKPISHKICEISTFSFSEYTSINIFFNKQNFNLVGWQTLDIYQNLNMTFISNLKKNQKIDKKIFNLPNR